ncbi:rod shape-determining protein MreC [Alkalilimnicola ehrlichii]|nr:rod shape-determining protein MreC [Alkalilimnicola ehrlichii]
MKPLFLQGPSITTRMVLCLLLGTLLMVLDHRQQLGDPVRQTIAGLVYPIHAAVDIPFRAGNFLSDQFGSRRQLIEENARLRAQQLLNETRLQRLDSLERENINLRALLQSSYEVGEPTLIAELMRVDLDPNIHLIQINRGSRDGLFVGQPVLDANGVVGQVDRLGPVSAMVRLITDPSHALPVQINRNGLRSVAMGSGDLRRLEVVNLPTTADVEVGDLLVTSGLGGRFPPGYPVARVTDVIIDPGLPFARIVAKPTAALDRSRQVLLVEGQMDPALLAPDAENSSGGNVNVG